MPHIPYPLPWLADKLTYTIVAAVLVSLLSLFFSLIQVRRKFREDKKQELLRDAASLPSISKELTLALSDSIDQNWADSIEVRQQMLDTPEKRGDVLAPPGQGSAPQPPSPSSEQPRSGETHETRSSAAR